MSNRYGITLDSAWTEWAAKEKISETVAAAVLLILRNPPSHEVVAKLTPGEFERVVDITELRLQWPANGYSPRPSPPPMI
jgi:hypothetical protein